MTPVAPHIDGNEPYAQPVASPVYPPLAHHLRIYVEYSNEIWSSGDAFCEGNWAQEQAKSLGLTKAQFNARRFCQICRVDCSRGRRRTSDDREGRGLLTLTWRIPRKLQEV